MQASLTWIVHDVFGEMPQRVWITHDMIIRLVLPNIALPASLFIDFVSAEGFPRVENLPESKSRARSEERMNVVWHHNPGDKVIAFSVEVPQGVRNNLCRRRIFEET